MMNGSNRARLTMPHGLGLVLLMGGVGVGANAEAQEQAASEGVLAEVIVTAQKRAENLQDVPISISVLTSDQLEARGITSFNGVAAATPSVTFRPYPDSANTLILYMRGQGNPNPGLINSEGAVGLYQDGFFIARASAATFDLADIDRVEVLRGPQGTLYGRNTTGGAVNLISKAPTGQFGFKQTLEIGNRNELRSLTTINLPSWAGIAAKVSGLKSSIDGFVKNPGSGHSYGEQAQSAGRVQLRWNAIANFTADYSGDVGDLDDTPRYFQNPSLDGVVNPVFRGYPYTGADQPLETAYRPIDLALSHSHFSGHGLTLAWEPSDTLTLKSLTGYRELQARAFQDYADSFTAAPRFPVGFQSNRFIRTHQFSQELQLIGNSLDRNLNYVVGLYHFSEDGFQDQHGANQFGSLNFTSYSGLSQASKSQALYGQISWRPPLLERRLELTLGGRYTKDDRAARIFDNAAAGGTGAVNSGEMSFKRFTPSFTANYRWSEDIESYAKVATAYRAGGFYPATTGQIQDYAFGPEKVTSYEAGLKSYWLGRKVRLNSALFSMDYRDMQIVFPTDPVNPGAASMYNAGQATITGAEMELLVAPVEDLQFSLDYAWLNATFDRVDVIPGTLFDPARNSASPYKVGDNIKNVFVMPQAPRHSLGAAVDYTLFRHGEGALAAHLDYRWQDRTFQAATSGPAIPNRHYNEVAAYGYLNGHLSWNQPLENGNQLTVVAWSNNLTDKRYVTTAIGLGGIAVATQNPISGVITQPGYTSAAVSWSEPRSYGIRIVYEYR